MQGHTKNKMIEENEKWKIGYLKYSRKMVNKEESWRSDTVIRQRRI